MGKTDNRCIYERLLLEPHLTYERRALTLASKIELVINNSGVATEGNMELV